MKKAHFETVPQEGHNRSTLLTEQSRHYQRWGQQVFDSVPALPSRGAYNLSVSHDKKFLWFRVAKVGTRTIFDFISKWGIKLDAEHAMACRYPIRLYEGYFKFAFVRNPWDRLVSCWRDKVLGGNAFNLDANTYVKVLEFGNFVDFVATKNITKCNHHYRSQSSLIDLNEVDIVGRFERFEKDLGIIASRLDAPSLDLGHVNSTHAKKPFQDYYNNDLRTKVAKIYDRDISIFGYQFA